MLPKLTVFVSSTVRDFSPVRRDLKEWLESRGADVRESEDPEFPVATGVHSHEACLRAIKGCHVFVLLVGFRYGGRFGETKQSITWREYDEARRLGIPAIKVILRAVNEKAIRWSKRGGHDFASFAKDEDVGSDFQDVAGFIDELRKGAVDNWIHSEWDGSFTALRQIVDARLNALFVQYQDPHHMLRRDAARLTMYAKARAEIDALVLEYASDGADRSPAGAQRHLDGLLVLMTENREALFGFMVEDRYNFAVYRLDGDTLRVVARQVHTKVPRHDRSWKVGIGHVGLAAQKRALMVSRNLKFTEDGAEALPTDAENYVSLVCAPIRSLADPNGQPAGVLVMTSNRQDHFQEPRQPEVSTIASVARLIALMGALPEPSGASPDLARREDDRGEGAPKAPEASPAG